ncbi:hypothetical protein [Kribbella speibonae]|uniref:hypothetical protein n=1 Tax=Kribbella speibonae TaxID=1572660 RepID=UPI001EDD4291|nr:hypothetical protein [Kribbella speibonae]
MFIKRWSTSAAVIVALTAFLLALLHLEAPSAHAKAAAPVVNSGAYGSGALGSWQANNRVISSSAEVRHVVASDGVVLFGDSIAVQDGAALGRLLGQQLGTSFAQYSWAGQPTSAAVDALEQWSRSYGLPRRIVMAVGSNDIFDPPAFAAQVERALRIAGPQRSVVWVDVQVSRTDEPTVVQVADQRNSEWINLQLSQAASRHPNLRIVHWAEFLAAQPERLHTDLRDGRHTTVPTGQNARNALILQAIRTS